MFHFPCTTTSSGFVRTVLQEKRDVACFEWGIQDFLSAIVISRNIESPKFSFAGSTWFLGLCEKYHWFEISLSRCSDDLDAPIKTEISFSIRNSDGGRSTASLYETAAEHVFDDCDSRYCCIFMLARSQLHERRSELLPFDNLTIICRLMECEMSAEASRRPRISTGPEKVLSRYAELLTSKKGCDVTIKVKDKEFEAHKTVLMAQSPVFEAMFEHGMSEAHTGVVNVPDCDPDSFGAFLQHLYTAKFEGVSPENACHLYVTADKYDVQDLKSYCVSYMMENLTVENVCDVLSLADQYEETDLMSCAKRFFNRYFNEILSTAQCEALFKENYALAQKLLMRGTPEVQQSDCDVQKKRRLT